MSTSAQAKSVDPVGDDVVDKNEGESGDWKARLHGEGSGHVDRSLFGSEVDLRVSTTRTYQWLRHLDF